MARKKKEITLDLDSSFSPTSMEMFIVVTHIRGLLQALFFI